MWDELEDAAEDYEKVRRNMDMHGFEGSSVRDYSSDAPTKTSKSSIQSNLDETFKQLDRLAENIEYLHVRLSDVLTPMPTNPDSNEDGVTASSNLGSKVNAIAYRLQDYNKRLVALAATVDL